MLAHAHASNIYRTQYKPEQGGHISITLNGDWAEPWDETEECTSQVQTRADLQA